MTFVITFHAIAILGNAQKSGRRVHPD